MDYIINKTTLYNLVDEEIAQAADQAYSDDGISLYDQVVLTSKDRSLTERFIDDAIKVLCRRLYDICSFVPFSETQAVDDNNEPLYYVVNDGEVTNEVSTTESDYPVYAHNVPAGTDKLYFYVPDIDTNNINAAIAEISRFIMLYAVTEIFKSRRANLVEQYANRLQTALDNVVYILKTRKRP